MANNFILQNDIKLNRFAEVEQLIKSTSEEIILSVTERRDQLLVQLTELKLEYIWEEETRMKQLEELEKIVKNLKSASIQQNEILQFQEDQLYRTQLEIQKIQQAIHIPYPTLFIDDVQPLLQQLKNFGSLKDLAAPYKHKFKPVNRFGKLGSDKGMLNFPRGIVLDDEQRMYIADLNNSNVRVLSSNGKFIEDFGKGRLQRPHSVAIFQKKWLFVSDMHANTVVKFAQRNGKFICKSASGEFNYPSGLTVDTDGSVLVADSYNNRVAVLDSDLKLVQDIGRDRLIYPRDVKMNENKIFVADNNRLNNVHVYCKSGQLLHSMIKLENGTVDIYICFDFYKNILISDCIGQSIQIFSEEGQLIHRIECKDNPIGIDVNNSFDIVSTRFDGVFVY